jgi:hypothetical protein
MGTAHEDETSSMMAEMARNERKACNVNIGMMV